jgi:hypothetical protein
VFQVDSLRLKRDEGPADSSYSASVWTTFATSRAPRHEPPPAMTTHDDVAPASPLPEARAPARSGLARRRNWLLSALVVGIVFVHLPALRAPLILDDYAHMAMVDGEYVGHRGPLGLYDFIDDTNRAAAVDLGVIPWWTTPDFVVRFFRPLSSGLLWLDYRIFGHSGFMTHLHTLVWWAAGALAVHWLLRRAFSPRVAWIGASIFALASCHDFPLGWVASRAAVVSTALGTFAIAAYARWREERRLRDALGGMALFALAMAAGEYSLCFTGYALAIEATRGRERLARRALGLAPFAAPLVAYLALRGALHYGAHGGGLYHDPLHDFGAYARGAPRRLGVLLTTAWLGVDDVVVAGMSSLRLGLVALGGAALLAIPVASALRGLDVVRRRRATWLLAGSLISLGPVLSVEASARLLGASMVGVSAVLALVIDDAWYPAVLPPRRGVAELTSFIALGLAFVHLVLAPIDTWFRLRTLAFFNQAVVDRMNWVAQRARGRSEVIAIRVDSGPALVFTPYMLGAPATVRWRVLTFESGRSLLLRTGDRSIELVASPNPLFPVGPGELFRDFDRKFVAGDTVATEGMNVTILQIDEKNGLPKRIRFDFDRDLDDPSYLWVTEGAEGFREQELPPTGYGDPILP